MHFSDEQLLNRYLEKYPKASLLVSVSDRDKQEFVSRVAEHLKLELVDITENISFEYLNDLYLKVDGYVYVINLDNLTLNKQNAILKFVEECPSRSYIILHTSIKTTVIPTIMTRCVEFDLYQYKKSDIKDYADGLDPLIVEISNSFDDVDKFRNFDLKSLNNLCKNIGNNIGKATIPNTLNIAKKYIYFKDFEQGKYSIDVFAKMLKYSLSELYKDTKSKTVYYLCKATVEFTDALMNTTLSREMLLDNFLLKLWRISRETSDED